MKIPERNTGKVKSYLALTEILFQLKRQKITNGEEKKAGVCCRHILLQALCVLGRLSSLFWSEVRLRGPPRPMFTGQECKGTRMLVALGDPAVASVPGTRIPQLSLP